MLVDACAETLLVPIFHLHLREVGAFNRQVFDDTPIVLVQILGVGAGDFFVQKRIVNGVHLPDFRLKVLDEGLVGILLNGELHDVLSIEVGFQQLGLVFVFDGLFFDGIEFFFRRFRQVFL